MQGDILQFIDNLHELLKPIFLKKDKINFTNCRLLKFLAEC